MSRQAPKRVAVLGGGVAGVTAAWALAQRYRAEGDVTAVLYEKTERLGGTVETVQQDGFTIECGPDGWISEKPWARQLVRELGQHERLIFSNDAGRVTYIVNDGKLVAMPDGMRMMVPTDLAALEGSELFSDAARAAYAAEPGRAAELKAAAPSEDESVAEFVRRHFGDEVLRTVAAPLLAGVLGGDVERLSVRAVMPTFVAMEREHGSLIVALQNAAAARAGREAMPIFTSLVGGTQALVDRMKAELRPDWVRFSTTVTEIRRDGLKWTVKTGDSEESFDSVVIALPAHVARALLEPLSARLSELLEMEATSAVVAALAFDEEFELPKGFGFLVPPGKVTSLLAATFMDQKWAGRTPPGGRLLRAFFGGEDAFWVSSQTDETIAAMALDELDRLIGPLPMPVFHVVRRWPLSLPQYGVGHLERMDELDGLVKKQGGLWLLGNAYRGVGIPDLIRDARSAVAELLDS